MAGRLEAARQEIALLRAIRRTLSEHFAQNTPHLSPLTHEWNTARNTAKGWPQFLEAVHVDGLRGWNNETVEFRFPVVAVAGENGAGKSTILKVAAAAYVANQENGLTFYPDDFFPNTPWESVEGVALGYRSGAEIPSAI